MCRCDALEGMGTCRRHGELATQATQERAEGGKTSPPDVTRAMLRRREADMVALMAACAPAPGAAR